MRSPEANPPRLAEVSTPPGQTRRRSAGALDFVRRFPGFITVVVAPTILAMLFFGFVQSNIYTSTAQFLVRSGSAPSSISGLGAFLQGSGITTPTSDAYAVNAYLTSRDALKSLEQNPGVRQIYARPEADFIDRFPNFFLHGSFENLFWHYTNWIGVDYNSGSGITTLTVKAFRPEDADALASQLLALSENEVNRINDRIRAGGLKAAKKEVADLQQRSVDMQNQITGFRNREALLDPTQSSTQSVALVSSLEADLASAKAALNQFQSTAPRSPQLPALRDRIAAIQGQINAEGRKGAGGAQSLAPKLADYQQLVLKQQVLQQLLSSAVTALEAAEATVQQQQLYIARVAEPNHPDRAQSVYDRLIAIIVSIFSFLLIYGIGKLLTAAVGDYVLS